MNSRLKQSLNINEIDQQSPVAIVGMACIFPGAGNLNQYWQNIQNGVCAITDVPESRWDPVFYDPNSLAADRFYCRKGGFVDEYVDFDPLEYGIMPKAALSADPDQLLSLRVGVEALKDAGLWQEDFNREKTGVVIGRGNYLSAGTLRLEQHVRLVQQTMQTLQDLVPGIKNEQLEAVKQQIKQQLTYYGPDTAVGLIPNLVASRLANRLDLNGPAYTVDGACASALLAVEQSCQSLRRGDTDIMLAGGLHFTHDLTFWSTFCQLGALSRSQTIRPLSANADGILAGEGIGMFVLKRLSDAKSHGDRIYAVIHGVASASDGNSSSLLAPAVEGQMIALQRAWKQTSIKKDDIGLLEAHGTGTPAGDNAEIQTLREFFGPASEESELAGLGSVKSMIGHTMPASGAAGLIKAALSVYHGIRPISLEAESPNPAIAETRFKLLKESELWPQAKQERVAAVNAFGFGGINAHVVLGGFGEDAKTSFNAGNAPVLSSEHSHSSVVQPALSVIRLAANSQQALLQKLAALDLSAPVSDIEAGHWRIAIIEPNAKRVSLAKNIIEKAKPWQGRSQIFFACEPLLKEGKVAFLFPGVDSAFNPQLDDVAEFFKLPLPAFCEELDPAKDLMKVGIGLTGVNKLLNRVLNRMNVQADAMAGHSIGEWSAMASSGCLSQALVDDICEKLSPDSLEVPEVQFLAVANRLESVKGCFEDLPNLHLSHDNCPHQIIFCGKASDIQILSERLKAKNILAQILPIVSGFHSPLLADFAKPFTDFYTSVNLETPRIPLWSANTAKEFPVSLEEKHAVVVDHLTQTVRFRELIENMHAEGFRAFIQVGFGSLTGFVADTLKNKEHFAFSANIAKRSGLEQLCHLATGLWVEGAEPDFSALNVDAGKSQKTSTSAIKLQLGVPLLKLSTPLDIRSSGSESRAMASQNEFGHASNDPLQQLFQQTLSDIHQASEDIQSLWQQRKVQQAPFAPPGSAPQGFVPFSKTLTRHLDVRSNIPLVMDHSFYPQPTDWPVIADRHPVIPLTMELKLMREAVQEVLPGLKVIALEDVKAFNWLIVVDPTDIHIEVEHVQEFIANVTINGYAQARAVLAKEFPQAPAIQQFPLKNKRPAHISAREMYDDNWMFHGPAYQSITTLGPMADNGIQGKLKVSAGEGALLDNMGQLAGYWVMEQDVDPLAMPVGVQKIHFYGPDPKVGDELHCDVLIRKLDKEACISDLQLIDHEQKINVVIEGWETRRFTMDKDFMVNSFSVQKRLVSQSWPQGFVMFLDNYEKANTRDYMVKCMLTIEERREYESLPPRRKRQWLAGRIAAKDAIRHTIWQRDGVSELFPKELIIESDEFGKPIAKSNISETYKNHLQISIAHKDKIAVAIAHENAVGIDIECIEAKSDNFVTVSMASDELKFIETGSTCEATKDEIVTRMWSAKEAVAKKLGTGLQGKPKSFVVEEVEGQKMKVNGHWVSSIIFENYVISWTE
ncbi:Narbonolide/10-deoxymethynolide synthase PikA2, modules 3 and 4 [Thalassocella blandensis]|nr:Narbonolide/10-deoxymethynolide synthase PikA2, modules 3 and 4 [Thalassocella blandensis]